MEKTRGINVVDMTKERSILSEQFYDLSGDDLLWSSVALSEVINKKMRLEASVYGIKGKQAREILNNCKWEIKSLCGSNGLANSNHRSRFKRIFVQKSDYPIYQPSQVNDVYPKPNLFISGLTRTDIEELRVRRNQILLTCSGTIGNVTFVSSTLHNQIFSHDLIRITANHEIDAGYIYAYLRTKIGNTIINTDRYGAVVKHVEPKHLQDIPIPYPIPEIRGQINELIKGAFELRDKSNGLLDKAQELLAFELKLPPIEDLKIKHYNTNKEIRNYQIRLSRLNYRMDASYHLPIVNSILSTIVKYADEVTRLGDEKVSSKIVLPGRFKRIYVKEGQGTVFFGGKQIFELDPCNKKYLSFFHHRERIEHELRLKENTILVTRSGTVGKVNITPKHWEDWVINEHVLRIVPVDKNIAGYIYAWLSSVYGYELIARFTYGAVVDEIDANHLSRVEIPLLKNKDTQLQINNLVLQANQKRYEAYIMEQKALDMMNNSVIYAHLNEKPSIEMAPT